MISFQSLVIFTLISKSIELSLTFLTLETNHLKTYGKFSVLILLEILLGVNFCKLSKLPSSPIITGWTLNFLFNDSSIAILAAYLK